MKNLFRRRPAKAVNHRSNHWKGARAVQIKDQTLQARRAELVIRCRNAMWRSGLLVAAACVCWAGLWLASQIGPVLQRGLEIREVSVEGVRQVTKQEVLDRLALRKGVAHHQLNLAYLAERVRNHPWIKEAAVERLPLHALRVTVVERKPAAIAQIASQHVLIDDEGVVLAQIGAQDQTTLPLIFGVDGKLLLQNDLRMKQRLQSSIELAKWMAETLDGRIEIDVSHPVDLVASARGVRFHFGSDGLKDQWDRFMKVKAAFKVTAFDGRKHDGHDVDLRYDDRVIVREGG